MGIIRTLVRSFAKTRRLRKLQLRIAPPGQSMEDLYRDFAAGFPNRKDEEAALDEYLTLREEDEGVAKVMRRYQLTRNDLREIYGHLVDEYLGQWIGGHYAALSTIAYPEPLLYFVELRSRGVSAHQIRYGLFEYWHGKIPNGGLYKALSRRAWLLFVNALLTALPSEIGKLAIDSSGSYAAGG